MRRGLMGWDEAELPRSVLTARLERLQGAMAREGLDALLLYTNIVRPSAVCWLTGFTPYWIESLLLVPRDGATVLATALSKRVSDWVRATSQIDDIVNTPRPGAAIGVRLVAAGARRAQRFAVRAWVAYKGSWVRRTRSFARDAAGTNATARAQAWLDELVSSLAPGEPLAAQLAARLQRLPGATLKNFMAESCVGSY